MSLLSRLNRWWHPPQSPPASTLSPTWVADPPPPDPLESSLTLHPLRGHPSLNEAGYWHNSDPAPRLVIFSGAGLSAESGLSLFRGGDGLWAGDSVDQVCNGRTWKKFRAQVQAFYAQRRMEAHAAQPNPAHAWCAKMEKAGAVLLTQNVDGLLQAAGADFVGHLHGRLDHQICFGCTARWQVGLPDQGPHSCPVCQGFDTRVDVVFFHESPPAYHYAYRVLGGLRPQDVLLVIGTTGEVFNPVAGLTAPAQVWLLDPDPSPVFLRLASARIFKARASEVELVVGPMWAQHLAAHHSSSDGL